MEMFVGLTVAIASLAVGGVLAAVLFRVRSGAILEAAVARGRSSLEIELASLLERVHSAEADLLQARHDAQRFKETAEGWRKALETSAHDNARLTERTGRLAAAEAEAARLALQMRMSEEELRRLGASEAQKDQSVKSLSGRVQQLERDAGVLQAKLDTALHTLHETTARRAALEEQAARLPQLEQQLNGADRRLSACNQQLLELRGSSSRENGRLAAELAGSRELTDRLRVELAAARGLQAAAEAQVASLARELGELRMAGERGLAAAMRHSLSLHVHASAQAQHRLALDGAQPQPVGWGERMLAHVLAASSLREGEDFTRTSASELAVALPQGHRLLLDTGLSLDAFEAHRAASSDDERTRELASHLGRVRQQVLAVAARAAASAGEPPPDFALVFVPDEAAFMLAVAHDGELFMDAWRRNVLLASPSTLLFVLRTVTQLWLRDAQTRHAQTIAELGAQLCEGVLDVSADLDALGERLAQVRQAFEAADTRLHAAEGGMLRRAQLLREAGLGRPAGLLPAA